jgi:hypothetical protein
LSLSHYPSASSKPQVIGDVSPGPNLPKEKEPPHRGDIGWDRFLLRQFGLQSYSLFPSYKLCDNRDKVFIELNYDSLKVLLSPSLGITKEIMSRGPQVLDMEYREPDRLEHGPGGPILFFFNTSTLSATTTSITSPGLATEMGLAP